MENFNKEDKEYTEVIAALKSLKKVSAKPNFEANLMRKINSEKFAVKDSIFQKFFFGRVLLPSAAAVVLLVMMIFFLQDPSQEIADPFSEMPKEREDVITTQQNDVVIKDLSKDETRKKNENIILPTPSKEKDVAEKKDDKSILDEGFTLKKNEDQTIDVEQMAPALFFKSTAIPDSEQRKLDSLKNRIFKDSLK